MEDSIRDLLGLCLGFGGVGGGWGLGLRKIEPFTLNPETPTCWLGLLLVAEAIEDIRNSSKWQAVNLEGQALI